MLKTYIEINLTNGFIQLLKSLAGAPILFVKKPNGSFCLYVNYSSFNNLTIKKWYLLPLIGESLNQFGQAKRFTQLDLTNAYHRMRNKEGDKWKIAFCTKYGYFKYQVVMSWSRDLDSMATVT